MSRIGKKPIPLLKGVEIARQGPLVSVKGPKGTLEQPLAEGFEIAMETGEVTVRRPSDSKRHRALHGLYRALLRNMVQGVSEGYTKTLDIEGVGYNAKAEAGGKVTMNIGFCHTVVMTAPKGVSVTTPNNTTVIITGTDKQKVGQFAAELRAVRPPEPYKGKGIRYRGEVIRRKEGKAVGGKG